MKKLLSGIMLVFTFLFVCYTSPAQTLDKKSLMSELGNHGKFNLTPQQQSELDASNQKLTDDLFELDKNAKSKEERDKGIDNLFDKREGDLDSIFGADDAFKDAKKELKKNTKGVRRKVKVAKLIL